MKPTRVRVTFLAGLMIILLNAVPVFGQQPVAAFSAQSTTGCFPITVYFKNESTGDHVSYRWDLGNGTTSAMANPVTTYFTPGEYKVTLTVTNSNGSSTITKPGFIKVYEKPVADFLVDAASGCAPLQTQFRDLSKNSNSAFTGWDWNFGDGDTSKQQEPFHVYTDDGSYNVTLKVTNSRGCTNTISKRQYIKVFRQPTASFSFSRDVQCHTPATIQFTNQSSGSLPLKYSWNFGDGNSSTTKNTSNIYDYGDVYSVRLIVTDNAGCSDTLLKKDSIRIINLSSLINAPDSVCTGSTAVVNGSFSQPPLLASWSFGDSSFAGGASATKIWNKPGLYTVKLVSSYPGCTDSTSKTVNVLNLPKVSFGAPKTSTCKAPFDVLFTDSTLNPAKWNWNFGDGGTSTTQQPTHTYNNLGSYTVKLTVTNTEGCSNTAVANNFVSIKTTVAKIANIPAGGCIPFSYNFLSGSTSPDGIAFYSWKLGNGDTSNFASPSSTYLNTGSYNIKLLVTSNDGCKDSVSVYNGIKSGTKPVVDFAASPLSQCFGRQVAFKDLSAGNIDRWLWYMGDHATGNQRNFAYTYKDTGTYTVKLIAWQSGCADSLEKKNYIRLNVPAAQFAVNYNCNNRNEVSFKDQSAAATSWLWDFGDGSTSFEQHPVHVYTPNKTYTVKLTVANDTCDNSIFKTITIAGAVPAFTADKNQLCQSDSARFTVINHAATNKYTWSFGDTGLVVSNAGVVTHKYLNGSVYTITMFVENVNGCRDTIARPGLLQVFAPKASFIANASSGCMPALLSFKNQSTTASGANNIASIKWIYGDGQTQLVTASADSVVKHSYADTGLYLPAIEITDSIGCSSKFVLPDPITISKPKAEFKGEFVNACTNNAVQLTSTARGLALQHLWHFSDGTSSAETDPFKRFVAEGDYFVKLIVTDSFGCKDSTEKLNYFRVKNPVASFAPDDSTGTCVPFKVTLTNTSKNVYSQWWDFGDGSSSTLLSPVHFFNDPGSYTVKLVVKRSAGCLDSVFKKIQINIPFGKIDYETTERCAPAVVSFNVKAGSGVSYLYDFDDGTSVLSADSSVSHQYTLAGAYLPKVVLKDPLGCIIPVFGADSLKLYTSTADFSAGKKSFCDSGVLQFNNLSSSGNTISYYLWDFGDGTSSVLPNPVHRYTTPGLFDVSLSIRNTTGCTDSVLKPGLVLISETPRFIISGDSSFCGAATVQLKAMILSTLSDTFHWKWNFGNGNTSSLLNPPPQLYNTPGTYTVELTANNNQGCSNAVSKVISINTIPEVHAGNDTLICLNTSTVLKATGADLYQWQPGSAGSCVTCANTIVSITENTSFVVTGTTSAGCKNTDTVVVFVKKPFTISSSFSADSICIGQTTQLSVSGADHYTWSPVAGLSNAASATTKASPQTTTLYKVIATDDENCFKDSAFVKIVVFPYPQVDAGSDLQTSFGHGVTIVSKSSTDVTNWEWRPGQTLSCTNCPSPVSTPVTNTTYTVKVTNSGGCSTTDQVEVILYCDKNLMFMPSAFTPNNDNLNDIFYPLSVGVFKVKSFRIFNRQGELVFINANFLPNVRSSGWNGTFIGKPAEAGNYLYIVDVICNNNEQLTYTGNILLLR